jgi:hypothetical protein
VEGESKFGSTIHREKRQEGGLGAPLTVEEIVTAEAVGQRRWRARTTKWSASDTGDSAVGTGTREARRGDGVAWIAERRCQNGTAARRLYGTAWVRGSHTATAR